MRRCLQLAANGAGRAAPNPMVGSVVVRDGRVIGEGWHRRYGQAHAEVNAIAAVADPERLRGATLYVNLEPCSHYGKTPPCCDLIVRQGLARVVAGMEDPFPRVRGEGLRRLREAGIEVRTGVLEEACRWLNRRFITFHTLHRPYVVLKWAQTADGYIDNDRDPDLFPPAWMTGYPAQVAVHRMRAEADAILVGTETVRRDDPSLTVREWYGPHPLRVTLDRRGSLAPGRRLFDGTAETLVFVPENKKAEKAGKEGAKTEYAAIDFRESIPRQIVQALYEREKQSLLVEGGARTLEGFLAENLWDEMHVFTSPLRLKDLPGPQAGQGIRGPLPAGRPAGSERLGKVRWDRYLNDRKGF